MKLVEISPTCHVVAGYVTKVYMDADNRVRIYALDSMGSAPLFSGMSLEDTIKFLIESGCNLIQIHQKAYVNPDYVVTMTIDDHLDTCIYCLDAMGRAYLKSEFTFKDTVALLNGDRTYMGLRLGVSASDEKENKSEE